MDPSSRSAVWNSHLLNKISAVKSVTFLCTGNLMQKWILAHLRPGYVKFFTGRVTKGNPIIFDETKENISSPLLAGPLFFVSIKVGCLKLQGTGGDGMLDRCHAKAWRGGSRERQKRFMAFLFQGITFQATQMDQERPEFANLKERPLWKHLGLS